MMTDIQDTYDLLYVNGCSFSRMPDDRGVVLEDQWPHLLGNLLGTDVLNDGLWNGSNQRIFRKAEEFLRTTTHDKSKILAVITFSPAWRYEIPWTEPQKDYASPTSDIRESWIRINMGHALGERPEQAVALQRTPGNKELIKLATEYIQHKARWYTPEWERLEGLSQCLAIDGLFRSHGVQCFYVFSFGWNHEYAKELQAMLSGFLTTDNLNHIAGNHLIDRFHPDHRGHQIIAQTLYNKLTGQ